MFVCNLLDKSYRKRFQICCSEFVLSNDTTNVTFPWKYLTLGKITIDNSIRYFSQREQTTESKPSLIKDSSIPRKQKKYFQKQKSLNIWLEKDLEYLNVEVIGTFI